MTLRKQIVILGSVLALGAALGIIPREARSGGNRPLQVHEAPADHAPDRPAKAPADSI